MKGEHNGVVIGIAGGSGSGKTTFSSLLRQRLSDMTVAEMAMDRYFKKERPIMTAPFSGKVFEDHNHPDSFNIENMARDLRETVQSRQYAVVIVEGLLTLYEKTIREQLDLKVFIDVMSDERIVRRLKRNMERGLEFDGISEFYLESVRFRHHQFVEPSRWHADLVINGHEFSARALDMIELWTRRQNIEHECRLEGGE